MRSLIDDKAEKLISEMNAGSIGAILEGLQYRGILYRINGICNSVKYNIIDANIIRELEKLMNDERTIYGYSISDFAYAALDLLGLRKYLGERLQVREFIVSKFDFWMD